MKKGKILLLALAGYVAYKFISKKQGQNANRGNLNHDLRLIELQTDSTEDAIKQTQKLLKGKYGIDATLETATRLWSVYLSDTNANPEQFDEALRQAGLLSSAASGGVTLTNL